MYGKKFDQEDRFQDDHLRLKAAGQRGDNELGESTNRMPLRHMGAIGGNQSHLGRGVQLVPCIELGAIISNYYYLGLHASWRFSNVSNKTTTPLRSSEYFLHEIKIEQYSNLLLKSGYKPTPRVMIYGLIGPSFAKWQHTSDQINQ